MQVGIYGITINWQYPQKNSVWPLVAGGVGVLAVNTWSSQRGECGKQPNWYWLAILCWTIKQKQKLNKTVVNDWIGIGLLYWLLPPVSYKKRNYIVLHINNRQDVATLWFSNLVNVLPADKSAFALLDLCVGQKITFPLFWSAFGFWPRGESQRPCKYSSARKTSPQVCYSL